MTLEVSSSTISCESITVDDSMVADGSLSIPGLGGGPFKLYHTLVACSIVGHCCKKRNALNSTSAAAQSTTPALLGCRCESALGTCRANQVILLLTIYICTNLENNMVSFMLA